MSAEKNAADKNTNAEKNGAAKAGSDKAAAAKDERASKTAAEKAATAKDSERGRGLSGRGRVAPESASSQPEHAVRPGRRRPVVLVAVIICSVIMVGSILLPSLSAIVSGIQRSTAAASTQAAATVAATTATTDASTDAATEAATTNSQMESLDSYYSQQVSAPEAKLAETPDDLASLINAANSYLDWGQAATTYATTDDERAHATDLLTKAQGYYDRYLALKDSNAARVSRAMCQYYLGDVAGAQQALLAVTQADPSYAPAWSDLATIYQAQGDTAAQTDALNQALAADPTDSYGLKSSVSQQLQALTGASSASSAITLDTTTVPSE